jgi:hypothetical protein
MTKKAPGLALRGQSLLRIAGDEPTLSIYQTRPVRRLNGPFGNRCLDQNTRPPTPPSSVIEAPEMDMLEA